MIYDERQDMSINIVVLDLREDVEYYRPDETTAASKFKKMDQETWANIIQVTASVKPNQVTNYPIEAHPSKTISVYANILPKKHQSQQQLPRKIPALLFPQNNVNTLANNSLINQNLHSNYLSTMAAAQSIVNLANSYNAMFVPDYGAPLAYWQQMMPPTPHYDFQKYQQALEQQQIPDQKQKCPEQHTQPLPQQLQQTSQIKRKPVPSVHSPTTQMSPTIEKRIQRKKSPRHPPKQQQVVSHLIPDSQSGTTFLKKAVKKKVSFNDTLRVHNYECMVEGDERKSLEREEMRQARYFNDDIGIDYHNQGERYNNLYNQPNNQLPIRKYASDNRLFDSHQHRHRAPHYHYNITEEEEEEDYGDIWKRPDITQKHHSKLGISTVVT